MEILPDCYECGTKMEMQKRGFYKCPNCNLDWETNFLQAMFRLEEFLDKIKNGN